VWFHYDVGCGTNDKTILADYWTILQKRPRYLMCGSLISLCNLCVLCVSVVGESLGKTTTETQRLHREEHESGLFVQSRRKTMSAPAGGY
jgi:hypothetical protein